MDITIILIALSLAIDSFSVSIAIGMANKTLKSYKALTVGLFFGFFQALMPILDGWVDNQLLNMFILLIIGSLLPC